MMNRSLLLLASVAFATPVAAQGYAPVQPLLTRWGFPPQALAVFAGSQAEAARALGPPVSDQTWEDEVDGGPDFRVLGYAPSGGARVELTLCTAPQRRRFGIRPGAAFCAMRLVSPPAPDAQVLRRAEEMREALQAVARGWSRYFRFQTFTVHLERDGPQIGRRLVVVLERYAAVEEDDARSPRGGAAVAADRPR